MKQEIFKSDLIPHGLPHGAEIIVQGKEIGKTATIGNTLFLKEKGVSSEAEYKKIMATQGKIMFHANFGLGSWQECVEGMKSIYEELTKRHAHLDRWTINFARSMGLPSQIRSKAPKETGLLLASPEEWLQLGQVVPIQPHLGDHMIGSPASVENLLYSLAAGVTTVGNLGQYFGYDYPGWSNEIDRTISTVKALGITAQLKDKGIVVTSNLDDGPTSLMDDRANYIGWAMIEKYIVEDLIGANLTHHFGNLVTEPKMRLAILLALDTIHERETSGAHVHGNTIYVQDSERNVSIMNSCLLFDIIGQIKRPTGHAVHAVPLTERERIPSPSENVQTIVMANQMAEEARKVIDIIDFSQVEQLKERIIIGGKLFRDRVLKGFEEMEIDLTDPIELLLALRGLGTRRMEELFGAGKQDEVVSGRKHPIIPSEMFYHTTALAEEIKDDIRNCNLHNKMSGKRILLLSTDVHEYGKLIIGVALKEAGADVVDIGHSVDVSKIIKMLNQKKIDGICISTHNGMALSYAKSLVEALKLEKQEVPVFIGGRLNELTEGILPRDVTNDLRMLNVIPCKDVMALLQNFLPVN